MLAKLALVSAILCCVILMSLSLQAQTGPAPQVVNIDFPGAIQTLTQTINDHGQIVGDHQGSSGVAAINYNPSSPALGTHSITASYRGDGTFAGSTPPVRTLTDTPGQGFTTLANFDGSVDGANPLYGYPVISNGNGYGTTSGGGTYEQGTVFKATSDGSVTTLYTFCSQINCTDGAEPNSGPVISGGNIYGTTYYGGAYGEGTVFELTAAGQLITLHSFCSQPGCTDGAYPVAGLVLFEGNFYGTTTFGGANFDGTVFEITPAGQLTTLYSFCSQRNCADGIEPFAGLVQVGGNFYGTTLSAGPNGGGTVFEITPAGQLTTLHSFCSQKNCADGEFPYAGLVLDNGSLYGTTTYGGANLGGTVFAITLAGQLTTLYNFCSLAGCADGLYPYAGLMLASDGNLYGTTAGGTGPDLAYSAGTVFGMTPAGQLTTLYTFCSQTSCPDGAVPYGGLVEGNNATLYGTTYVGGSRDDGTIFSLPVGLDLAEKPAASGKKAARFSIRGIDLAVPNFFARGTDPAAAAGVRPNGRAAMFHDASGAKIRTAPLTQRNAVALEATAHGAAAHSSNTQALTNILNFEGANGAAPTSSLIQGNDGNFYGTTEAGGTYDQGTVFQLTPDGTLTTLYTFCSQTLCADGDEPGGGGLVQAANGNFYGIATGGGANGVGTVFEITSAGQLTTLYSFCSQPGCTDGASPIGALVQASNGNLYGTTSDIGANGQGGTVFEITPEGQLTTLYSFCSQTGCTDGDSPRRALVQASNGNLYGTTLAGGVFGSGTVFQITPGGTLTTLYSFCSEPACTDGIEPRSELVQGPNGDLYGTTSFGGADGGGTVFQITLGGALTTLYSFCSQPGCTDGSSPYHGLALAYGNFYGTTLDGGPDDWGTVFEITPAGQFATVYGFGLTDGAYPDGLLLLASNGNLYGTTYFGGNRLDGTVFSLPPVVLLTCPSGTAQVGVAYSSALAASGGVAPYTYSIIGGALPPGLSLNASTGAITGTPTTVGAFSFTSQVVDSQNNTATASCSIVVSAPTLTLGCPTGTAQVGVAYSSALTVVGGVAPYTFSIIIGALPTGLSLNPATGAITGTPGTAGTFTFTSQVVDSQNNTATASCSIVVSPPTLTLGCPTGTAQVGVAYSSALTAAGGVPPYTFSISGGALPPGLALNASTGAITGTPTTSGTFTFTSQVVDSKSTTATASCSIVVSSASASLTSTSLSLVPSSVTQGSAGPVVMTATVVPSSGIGTPTGTVAYFNDSTQIGTATLSGRVATFNYNPSALAVGPYSITAIYSGDSTFAASTSPPQTLGITQAGPFAYVANSNGDTVSVVNIPTGQVVNTIPVGSGPWGTAISPDQSQVYVSNSLGNNVSVINTASGTVVATIPVQSSPFGLAFTPDGSSVYVVNGSSNGVSVINTVSQTVVATVAVQNSPVGVAMAPTSEGTFAYVTNSGSNSVSVIAVGSSPTVVQTIPVGTGPRWVAVSPSSALAYVENAGSNNVSVISVASNTVTATVPVGTGPDGAAFSPDSSMAYVANSGSNTVSVIATAASSVVATVAGFNNPVQVALTTDGSAAYVTNLNTNNVSVITTSSNTITATVGVGSAPIGVAIASAAPTTLLLTQPLSPTQPNVFNFGINNQVVQYPPGTSFSGINMTTTAVQLSQAAFQQRLAGTQFANATCIIYAGSGGNCTDYQVTCSDTNGNPVSCPSEAQPTIAVQTGFTTSQSIVNPGYLTTPIGENEWQNIFTGFSDPTVKGKTHGFSEFVAVSLGATNAQGAANFTLLYPQVRTLTSGATLHIAFKLNSVVTKKRVTDATAGLAITMIADVNGNPTSVVVLSQNNVFLETSPPGVYKHEVCTQGFAPGKYSVTIFGNAFSSYQFQFKITP